MKYILVGWKIDEETGDRYDMDILETSSVEIVVIRGLYPSYDELRVYKQTDEVL